jgi:DNA-binding MarR family transcriptional regulator
MPRDDSDAYRVTWLIRRLFRAMGQRANEKLSDRGLTAADRAVLEFLSVADALTVPEIATRYQVSRQHIQVMVNGLVAKGLLTTRKNPQHKRSLLIALTARGRKLFASILDEDLATIEEWFAEIPAPKRKELRQTLESLLRRITDGESNE